MANTPQAVKRIKINGDKRKRNQAIRTDMRSAIRQVQTAVKAKNAEEAQEKLGTAISKIDKAVQRNILQKNNGDRKKSKLMQEVNSVK
ncbi:30S ribosomal protein S20 [Halalkalibacillus halophilus]|uniref:30S ribosomal protein S20 n=1 Tax=Halalkalibacillus halophilus TaxID=392827 RepID=UPI0003FCC65A|nr:30S ribosomal protein S20 [Halalkalibacillus halophilus]